MSRRAAHKRKHFNRAAPNPGSMMSIPVNALQNLFNQAYYGNKTNAPMNGEPLFSPGRPLDPQPNVDPLGKPVQFRFPLAYNTYFPDRSLGNQEIPSFQVLRSLAKLCSGITLCERAWMDMVPRMKLKIELKQEYVAAGAEEKDYQKEIAYFLNAFEKPDGRRDLHTWIKMALREQTQIDELYIYKDKTRGGKLQGLRLISGDTMKPILDDWGDIPLPTDPQPYAFQQYPWGIPGMLYSTDMMFHYQESPATDTPYGQSRVERVIYEVNQFLRKQKRDLAMFTEGNIPAAIGEVPESTQWTPDQIDAFEQAWNSLIAGNAQQQVRMRFTMPGMKITKLDSGEILTDFDMFLLNKIVGCYGMSMGDLAFTGDIHKSSGDSQQNVLYRRTIEPLAMTYANFLTICMDEDFPPAMHGEMFQARFGGFDESEDLNALVGAYSQAAQSGLIGITDATKALKFPQPPNAPYIGRVMLTKDGPMFLDDMASDKLRNAAMDAKLAGFQLAANPPQEGDEEGEGDDTPTQSNKQKDVGKAAQEGQKKGASVTRKDEKATKPVARSIEQGDTSSALERASKDTEEQTGMMLAFMLDPETAQQLAIPDGEPVNNLHITLAYLGDMKDEVTDDKLRANTSPVKIRDAVQMITSKVKPLSGSVGGVGRFFPAESEETPVIALVDVPGLTEFRTELVEAIESVGYFVADNHGYTPHITLDYVDADASMPVESVPSLPLNLDAVCLCVGSDRSYFKMGSTKEDKNHTERAVTPNTQQYVWRKGTCTCESCSANANMVRAQGEAYPSGDTAPGSHEGCDCKVEPYVPQNEDETALARADYKRWRTRAIEDIKLGRAQRGFTTTVVPQHIHAYISQELARCTTADEVRAVFARAREGVIERYNENHDAHGKFATGGGGDSSSGSGGGGSSKNFNQMSTQEKVQFLEQHGGSQWENSLTNGEEESLAAYAWDASSAMNGALRRGEYPNHVNPEQIDLYNQRAERALLKSSSPTDMTVLRQVGNEMYPAFEANVGKHFVDRGFCSTTINSDVPSSRYGDVSMHIRLPQGSPGAYLGSFTVNTLKSDHEWLLPPNAKFKIVHAWSDAGGNKHVALEYVGQHNWG